MVKPSDHSLPFDSSDDSSEPTRVKQSETKAIQPWSGWETVGLTLVILGVFLSISTAIALFFITIELAQNPALDPQEIAQSLETNGLVLSIATILAGLGCSGLIYTVLKVRPALTVHQYLALRKPRWTSWLIWNGLLLALMQFSDAILRAFKHQETFTTQIYQTAHSPLLLYLAIVGVAPLFEELLFRGFLFQGLQSSRLGPRGAIVITALGWAVLHVQYGPLVISQIVCFGLLFGMARWRTHSLFIPLSMHCLNNFLSLWLTGLQLQ